MAVYPRLEEVGRLKSFRQQSLRKIGSIRNLETLRQGSFRQLDPAAFTEIAHTSMSSSFILQEEEGPTSTASSSGWNAQESFGDSAHGPISTIEFVPGQEDCDAIEIEIAPGVYKRLKGSQETQSAWEENQCQDALCFVCDTILAVAPGCDSVICPLCRSISPIFREDIDGVSDASQDSWWLTLGDGEAVGLGIAIPHSWKHSFDIHSSLFGLEALHTP